MARAQPQIDIDIDIDLDGSPDRGRRGSLPEELGRYVLCGEIASGGMASIHLAVARGLGGFGKVLAVKRMHPHLVQEPQFIEMFLDEARIASRLDHPNVCSVIDVGHDGQCYFLVMEYLLGEPLRAVLQRLRPFRTSDPEAVTTFVTKIVADACEGLHAAHEARDAEGSLLGVVHRDVSPHNLFICYDGTTKLVDFGIASASDCIHQTQTGILKGKLSYMAPEQIHGDPIDRRTDVWALGVVLWESLTGRPLFRRRHGKETILAVTHGDVPPIRELAPRVPTELDDVVRRALQPAPDERFPTARAMGRALRTWLAMQEHPADTAVVSAWMRRTFPGELDVKRRRLQCALKDAETHAPVPSPPPTAPGRTRSRVVRRPAPPAPGRTRSRVVRRPAPPRARHRGALVAMAAIVLGTGAGLYVRHAGPLTGPHATSSPDPMPRFAADRPRAPDEAPPVSPIARTASPPSKRPGGSVGSRASDPDLAATGAPRPDPGGQTAPVYSTGDPELDPSGQRGRRPARAKPGKAATKRRRLPTKGTRSEAAGIRAAPSTDRAEASGQIQVAARGGWAQVYLGRRLLGPTPGRFTLPAGRHTLTLRPEQGEARRTHVHVLPDEVARVTVDLQP